MRTSAASPLALVALVGVLSLPLWLLGAVTGAQLSPDLPLAALVFVTPGIAALLLVWRQRGAAGAAALLRRLVQVRGGGSPAWPLAAALLLAPALFALTYVLLGDAGPAVNLAPATVATALAAYLVAAAAEELGWTAFATEPLQRRLPGLAAALLLGGVMVAFHVVPLLEHGRSAAWIGWWALSTVAARVLTVWLFNAGGGSVVAAVLFHAAMNTANLGPVVDFGPAGFPLAAQRLSALLLAAAAAAVTAAWGPGDLGRSGDRRRRAQSTRTMRGTSPAGISR